MKRCLTILLSLCMVMTAFVSASVSAEATSTAAVRSGVTGDCTWTRVGDELTVVGNGKTDDYSWSHPAPWGTGITKAVFKEGVTYIGSYACKDSLNLTDISIPDTVTGIGYCAFYNCQKLKEINLPDSVIDLGMQCFDDTAWYSGQPDGLVYLSKIAYRYKGTFPAEVSVKKGTLAIADGAFYDYNDDNQLKRVYLADGIKRIGYDAFRECENLAYVTFPDSLVSIGSYAFYSCSKLETIDVPDKVVDVGANAFLDTAWYNNQPNGIVYVGKTVYKYKGKCPADLVIKNGTSAICEDAFLYCTELDSVTLPASLTKINGNPFRYTYLSKIIVDKKNPVYDSRENCNAVIETASDTLVIGCGGTVIPESVKRIGDKAFYECWSLYEVTIPAGVINIGEYAFSGSNLSEISVSENNKVYDSREDCNAVIETDTDTLVYGCYGTVIPNTVVCIGKNAFFAMMVSKTLTIPDSVTDIGDRAFSQCDDLEEIIIGSGVKHIGDDAFMNCGIKSLSIPDSVEVIGNTAFANCYYLEDVTIGKSVNSIPPSAFENCESLKEVIIPGNTDQIGEDAFRGCRDIEKVVIEEGVQSIGKSAFSGCESLKEIVIPDSVDSIGLYAFDETPWYDSQPDGVICAGKVVYRYKGDCPEHIEIRQGVVSISEAAFYGCENLKSVTIPDSVKIIGDGAFAGCENLKSVTIPKSVTHIGYKAFNFLYYEECYWISYWDSTVIYGYPSTDAERFANEFHCVFVPLEEEPTESDILPGDVDQDGVISVLDATRIQKYKASLCNLDGTKFDGSAPSAALKKAADVDSDGVISVLDATRIQKYKAHLCNLDGTTPYAS